MAIVQKLSKYGSMEYIEDEENHSENTSKNREREEK